MILRSAITFRPTFQSTHPRGVRPAIGVPFLPHLKSFNPRTRVGCDSLVYSDASPLGRFNPRTRVGCDISQVLDCSQIRKVSIHAPAWGATRGACRVVSRQKRFNPRTRVGCDAATGDVHQTDGLVSIHAPAWGATYRGFSNIFFKCGFNPRTRVGCDRRATEKHRSCLLFQSTHPRGVRRSRVCLCFTTCWVSIHAPAWGATPIAGSR